MKRSDYLAMAIAPAAALLPSGLLLGDSTRFFMLLGAPVSYFLALLIGWPLLTFLQHRGWARFWILSFCGLILSSPFAVLLAVASNQFGWRPVFGVLLAGAVGGGLVWLLAVGPNNSFKPKPLRGSA